MNTKITRRAMIGTLGTAVLGAALANGAQEKKSLLVLGIACSPRQEKGTAKGIQIALAAAEKVAPSIKTAFIDLGGMNIGGWNGSGFPADDFQKILPQLKDPHLSGIIIGSPVYFRNMSALCKAFIEQCNAVRKPTRFLANKLLGALAVGKSRNGGQELVIQQIHSAMLCHEMIIVGGRHPSFQGGTLISSDDTIEGDDYGIASAVHLGQRIAEVALLMH